MQGNPFYVKQGPGIAPGLQGLAGTVETINARKKQEAAIQEQKDTMQAESDRVQGVRSELAAAFKNKDGGKIQELALKNPSIREDVDAALKRTLPEEGVNDLYAFLRESAFNPASTLKNIDVLTEKFRASGAGIDTKEQGILAKYKDLASGDPEKVKQARFALKGDFFLSATPEDQKRYSELKKSRDEGTEEDEPLLNTYSVRNEDGSVDTLENIKPGSEQEKQLIKRGLTKGKKTVGIKPSEAERAQKRLNDSTDKLTKMANEDPNKFYSEHNYRQNDDGSLFIDPVEGGPQELKVFTDILGKRGNLKAVIALGEQWDDSKELMELLQLPSVQSDLKKAKNDGMWDRVTGKWNNSINKWLQDQGIKGDSPTATAIARTQKMASEERHRLLGAAVTQNEEVSTKSWMPAAGDSYETMINKTRLMSQEAEQQFRRFVKVSELAGSDMSPFMDAFGIKKYDGKVEKGSAEKTDEELKQSLGL